MTSEAKWELLGGWILLRRAESEEIVRDSSMAYVTREFHLRRLDFFEEVEEQVEELNDRQAAEKEEQHETPEEAVLPQRAEFGS